MHRGIHSHPILKNTTPSFLPSLPLNLQTVQVPLFRQSSLYMFFVNPTLKVGFFNEHPKYFKFFVLNPSYLLKVTKFLVKISKFEFLVMTEKNIFVYKLLSLNISGFTLFLCKNYNPPPPPLFWKLGRRFNPPAERGQGGWGEGVHTMMEYTRNMLVTCMHGCDGAHNVHISNVTHAQKFVNGIDLSV